MCVIPSLYVLRQTHNTGRDSEQGCRCPRNPLHEWPFSTFLGAFDDSYAHTKVSAERVAVLIRFALADGSGEDTAPSDRRDVEASELESHYKQGGGGGGADKHVEVRISRYTATALSKEAM